MRFNRNGLTAMEQSFVRAHAKTNNATFAAWQAGYSQPNNTGNILLAKPKIQSAIRQETQRFLYEEAGGIGASVLGSIATNDKMPAGARVKAAEVLCKLANIAIKDDVSAMPENELTAKELDEMRRKLAAQRQAVESVLSSLPRVAIDADVFG